MPVPDPRLDNALRKCATEYAPDPRVTVFDVSAKWADDTALLSGTVLNAHLKAQAVEAIERVADAPVSASDLSVLEADEQSQTVTVSVAAVRADPDEDAEQVTQVLYGARLTAYDRQGAWRRVRTPDGYVAWVRRSYLRTPTEIDAGAVITSRVVESEDDPAVYAGTECEILASDSAADGSVRVRFRTGEERPLPADAVGEVSTEMTGEAVAETARKYLGTEYVWGGMTVEGIDCSGLAWMAYHRHGITLPRDADLQRRMGREVSRDELVAGDLLFFPGHVAMSLGGSEFVHAYGSAGEVVVGSLDPKADRYDESLDEDFELAKRLV